MGLDTDGRGFPHPQELRAIGAHVVAAVHCRDCGKLVARDAGGSLPVHATQTLAVFGKDVVVALVCTAHRSRQGEQLLPTSLNRATATVLWGGVPERDVSSRPVRSLALLVY